MCQVGDAVQPPFLHRLVYVLNLPRVQFSQSILSQYISHKTATGCSLSKVGRLSGASIS